MGGGSTTQPPPNLARACPSLKKFLRVGQLFLRLCAKLQVSISNQKVFWDQCVRPIFTCFFACSLMTACIRKIVKSHFCCSFSSFRQIITKLGIIVLLDDTLLCFQQKFDSSFFRRLISQFRLAGPFWSNFFGLQVRKLNFARITARFCQMEYFFHENFQFSVLVDSWPLPIGPRPLILKTMSYVLFE